METRPELLIRAMPFELLAVAAGVALVARRFPTLASAFARMGILAVLLSPSLSLLKPLVLPIPLEFLRVFPFETSAISQSFLVDTLSAAIMIGSTALLLRLLFLEPQNKDSDQSAMELVTPLVAFALFTAACRLKDLWWQWGCLALWDLAACMMIVSAERSRQMSTRGVAKMLIWLTAANGFWVLSLAVLYKLSGVTTVWDLSRMTRHVTVSTANLPFLALPGIGMALALAIRAAQAPMIGWAAGISATKRQYCWLIFSAFVPALILGGQIANLLHVSAQASMLMQVAGVSACLWTIMAWAAANPSHRWFSIAAAQMGITVITVLGTWRVNGVEQLPLLLSFGLIVSLILLCARDSADGRARSSLGNAVGLAVFLWEMLIHGGIAQQVLLGAAVSTQRTFAMTFLLVLLGVQLLTSAMVFDWYFGSRRMAKSSPEVAVDKSRLNSVLDLLLWFLSGLICWRGQLHLMDMADNSTPMLASMALVLVMGALASLVWPGRFWMQAADAVPAGTLRKLAQRQFYIPALVNQGIVAPVRLAARIAECADRQGFETLGTTSLPALLQRICHAAEDQDEEAGPRESLVALVLAALLMVGIVSWGLFTSTL